MSKFYSVDNAFRFGERQDGEFVLMVKDSDDSEPHMTTVRSYNKFELLDIANLLNLAPEILRSRAKAMTTGKKVA